MAILDHYNVPVIRRTKRHTKQEELPKVREFNSEEHQKLMEMFDKRVSYDEMAEYFECDKMSVIKEFTKIYVALEESVCNSGE